MTQKQGQVTLSEDDFLFINCTYSTTGYPSLFWYVQYPGEGPELLLKVTTANNKGNNRGFEATYDKESTSFHLQKAAVKESDSALYYCALSDTVTETAGGAEYKLRGAKQSLASDDHGNNEVLSCLDLHIQAIVFTQVILNELNMAEKVASRLCLFNTIEGQII